MTIYARIEASEGPAFIQSRLTPFADAMPFEVDSEDFLEIHNGAIRTLTLAEATIRKRARATANRQALIEGELQTEGCRMIIAAGGNALQLRAFIEAKYPPPPVNLVPRTTRTGTPTVRR